MQLSEPQNQHVTGYPKHLNSFAAHGAAILYETQANAIYTRYPKHLNSFAAHGAAILYETHANQNEQSSLLIIVLFCRPTRQLPRTSNLSGKPLEVAPPASVLVLLFLVPARLFLIRLFILHGRFRSCGSDQVRVRRGARARRRVWSHWHLRPFLLSNLSINMFTGPIWKQAICLHLSPCLIGINHHLRRVGLRPIGQQDGPVCQDAKPARWPHCLQLLRIRHPPRLRRLHVQQYRQLRTREQHTLGASEQKALLHSISHTLNQQNLNPDSWIFKNQGVRKCQKKLGVRKCLNS